VPSLKDVTQLVNIIGEIFFKGVKQDFFLLKGGLDLKQSVLKKVQSAGT
jgi:hypothetical protein